MVCSPGGECRRGGVQETAAESQNCSVVLRACLLINVFVSLQEMSMEKLSVREIYFDTFFGGGALRPQ